MIARVFIIFLLNAFLLSGCTETKAPAPEAGGDFILENLDGKSVKLSDYRGRVVLLEFWATWCPPCRASVPVIEQLHRTYEKKGLTILAISMDEGGWDDVKAFVKDYGITYTVLKGTDEVTSKYRVRLIPTMFLVDKQGKVYPKSLGGFGSEEALEKDIKALL